MNKKIVFLVVLLAMMLLLTACGSKSSDDNLVYYDGTYLQLDNGAHAIHIYDGCCSYFDLEISAADGVYPEIGTKISIQGTMNTYTNESGIATPRIETERLIIH